MACIYENHHRLWQAVLSMVVRDIEGGPASHATRERIDAERWVGSFPSGAFRTICERAGYCPDTMHKKMKSHIAHQHQKREEILRETEELRKTIKKEQAL